VIKKPRERGERGGHSPRWAAELENNNNNNNNNNSDDNSPLQINCIMTNLYTSF
jgi:hypothetical protein